jgi:YfiH family protein
MNAALWAQWPAPANVRAFTTLRHGAGVSLPPFDEFNLGARCGDDTQAVADNRAALVENFALPSSPRWLQQVHGIEVMRFSAPSTATAGEGAEEPIADASVTSAPDVVLAILTADCLPIVFAAEDGSEIGAAHAGWRGLASGVLENTVAAMHTPAGKLVAWLGPAAGPQAYEIGEEVFDAFVSQDARAASAFAATRPGHWRVDLYEIARQRLGKLGVTRAYGGDLCTISDPQRFYSHRRSTSMSSGRTGRMATVVWMAP